MQAEVLMLTILVLLLLHPALRRCESDFVHNTTPIPIVGIEMNEAGFHRDLLYTVQFDYPLAGKECDYVLEQSLPAAVYVSVDQLDDLKRLKTLNAIYPTFVDIEAPTEKAVALTVLLKGAPKVTDTIKLPIHFRYHAPSDKSTFAAVEIPIPRMFMHCPDNDNDLIDNELQAAPSVEYCLVEEALRFIEHAQDANDDSPSSQRECDWKLINVDFRLKSPLRAEIPVGNEKAFPPILYATIIVSWCISLWTVFRTHYVPRRINQKLEEQRILQNKIK